MRSNLTANIATILAILITSCSSSNAPSAPSLQVTGVSGEDTGIKTSGVVSGTKTSKTSITGLYFNSCVPELVDVTGDLHLVSTRKENADGSVEVTGKFTIKGSGTGRKTGASYNVIAHTTDEFTYTAGPPFPYTRTFDRVIKLVSSGTTDNATITLTIDLTVNSSGVVVSRTAVSSADCR